jgi:hypothetical protein
LVGDAIPVVDMKCSNRRVVHVASSNYSPWTKSSICEIRVCWELQNGFMHWSHPNMMFFSEWKSHMHVARCLILWQLTSQVQISVYVTIW